MGEKKANPIRQNLIKSILLGLTWFFIAFLSDSDKQPYLPYIFAAAGVAFIVEGIIKYKKAIKSETD